MRAESWGTVTFRGWERAEELGGGQKRHFRDGGREVGRCNVTEIKKGDASRRRGGAAAKCAEVEEKKHQEAPVDFLIRRPAAVSPPGQGRRR